MTPMTPKRPTAALQRFADTVDQARLTVGLDKADKAFLADLETVLAYVASLEADKASARLARANGSGGAATATAGKVIDLEAAPLPGQKHT